MSGKSGSRLKEGPCRGELHDKSVLLLAVYKGSFLCTFAKFMTDNLVNICVVIYQKKKIQIHTR